MTKDEFISNRKAAGEAYRKAAEAYVAAWEVLHCHDLVHGNGNLALALHAPGFAAQPVIAAHAEFLRDVGAIHGRAAERANAAHEQMLANIKD
ncbi:hypothetical protein [Paraburkholderia strydomiana]|jgi:hypothetical protein|uniref:hypothetical protein n=1 Tax=Paraburkholderia strydomiana TaxID=1245417 RepID=UPI0038BA8927